MKLMQIAISHEIVVLKQPIVYVGGISVLDEHETSAEHSRGSDQGHGRLFNVSVLQIVWNKVPGKVTDSTNVVINNREGNTD